MIEFVNISKTYGFEEAVKNVNLKLEEGKIYGLIGRSGAGKTTLLKILSNQIARFDGKIVWKGEEVFENQKLVEEIIYVSDDMDFMSTNGNQTPDKIFNTASKLYKHWDSEFAYYLIKEFDLDIYKGIKSLSKGYRTIVNLILGLASRGEITIFDEPSNGLDANNRYKFYKILMEDIEDNPRTVFISTHIIDEIENVLEEVIIIKEGEIILHEELLEIQEKAWMFTGKAEVLEALNDKNIVYRDKIGSLSVIGIYDKFSPELWANLKNQGVDVGAISLQNLLIYMTDEEYKNEQGVELPIK